MIEDVFRKLALNLTPGDQAELMNWIGDMKTTRAAVGGLFNGTIRVVLNSPQIADPTWQSSALGNYTFKRVADATIGTGSDTVVTFDTFYGDSPYFRVDASDATKIRVYKKGFTFQLSGNAEFAANATGYRNMKLLGYDESDVLLGTIVLDARPAISGVTTIMTASYVLNELEVAALAYFKITVAQTSGGDLVLNYLNLGAYLT